MLDHENAAQQEALGIVGVNLLYGAFFLHHEPDCSSSRCSTTSSTDRIEIDMIEFSGIEFRHVDNRVMSLRLVQLGLTGAAMFSADGSVLQPSEVLYKKPMLVERGSFRPVTHVNVDMLAAARCERSRRDGEVEPGEAGLADGDHDAQPAARERRGRPARLPGRADVLARRGMTVLISDYFEYYRLAAYLARYTKQQIGITMGAASLRELFDEKYYATLDGGILESFGRLFKNDLKLYVYPLLDDAERQARRRSRTSRWRPSCGSSTGTWSSAAASSSSPTSITTISTFIRTTCFARSAATAASGRRWCRPRSRQRSRRAVYSVTASAAR